MKKTLIITGCIIAGLIMVLIIISLVWGKTMHMANANKLLLANNKEEARTIYEDMAIDVPNNTFILHNLGLVSYLDNKFEQAAENLRKAIEALGSKPSKKLTEVLFKCQYHLGNALFNLGKNGEKSSNSKEQQPANFYQEALFSFKKAIETNTQDHDAKYNYELTKLHVQNDKQNQSEQNNKQEQNQQNKEKNKDKSKQNQKDQKNQKNEQQQKQQQQKQQQQQQQNKNDEKQMSKEEAEALLDMAENGEQYQGTIVIDSDAPAGKDW